MENSDMQQKFEATIPVLRKAHAAIRMIQYQDYDPAYINSFVQELLTEIARLEAGESKTCCAEAYAEGMREGQQQMRERAATECATLHQVHPRASDREPDCAGLIRALPLSTEAKG